MPNLDFYATSEDVALILDFVLQECRVFESYSRPDEPLRSFSTPVEVCRALEQNGPGSFGLVIYSPSMKGEFIIERVVLREGAVPGKSWREQISGWGFISMVLRGVQDGKLGPSFTNHNSETRAYAWEETYPAFPTVRGWDFREVTRISRRINHRIVRLAIRKEGARSILPGADALLRSGEVALGLN